MSTEKFIQDRKYLKAVTEKTLSWYAQAFKAFEGALDSTEAINGRIVELRKRGVKPVSVNTYLRAVKAYYLWQEKKWEVGRLQEEHKVLKVFSTNHIQTFINWKAVSGGQRRLKTLILCAADSGMRVDELLGLRRENVNLDALTFLVQGKGNKQRFVPMSIEFRKFLYRHMTSHEHALIFCTKEGRKLMQRNLHRDFNVICKRLRIKDVRTSFHTLRHCFSVNYLKKGGNLYYLQRILGHNSITTTERYVRSLGIEDIVKVHSSRSLLCG